MEEAQGDIRDFGEMGMMMMKRCGSGLEEGEKEYSISGSVDVVNKASRNN